ncbi:hypothetical protein NDU88_005504 [Pleurodeles waltl]|uniref:Uncharacterized protein n=1 Tax=Pleurodeles waltl TaxID=8319 RepID=A0AAV7TUF5_PLEWA|nr:hypothetical protein NDU88_005504 [Pleurodeles waltl]
MAAANFCHHVVVRHWQLREQIQAPQKLGASVSLMEPDTLRILKKGQTYYCYEAQKVQELLRKLQPRG